MGKVYTRFQAKTAQKTLPNGAVHTYIASIREYPPGEGVSLTRKQPTFRYATTGLAAKWRLRNERRNSILMTRHYPDLGSASDCLFFFFNQSEALPTSGRWRVISMDCSRFNTENCSVTKRDDYVIMLNKKEMYSNQPGEKKKNTIQENDSEDRVGRRIWKKIWKINSRPPGFYLMRKREKLASIMIGTKVVCDRLRFSNLSSWLMKAFSTNAFAIVRPS